MSDKTSVAYQAALGQLRTRHPEEFETLFSAECKRRGLATFRTNRQERDEKIVRLIRNRGWVEVGDVAGVMGGHINTNRNDLNRLAKAGVLTKSGHWAAQFRLARAVELTSARG